MTLKSKIIKGVITASIIGGVIGGCQRGIQKEYKHSLKDYEESQQPIKAIVLRESYENRLQSVPEKYITGLVSQAFSNETVKLDSAYTLKIRTEYGKLMGLSVIDGEGIKKESLDQLIEEGSIISFPKGNLIKRPVRRIIFTTISIPDRKETYIKEDTQVATKRVDRIKILPKDSIDF